MDFIKTVKKIWNLKNMGNLHTMNKKIMGQILF